MNKCPGSQQSSSLLVKWPQKHHFYSLDFVQVNVANDADVELFKLVLPYASPLIVALAWCEQVPEPSGSECHLWGGGRDRTDHCHVSYGHSEGEVPGSGQLRTWCAVRPASAAAGPLADAAPHVCRLRLGCHLFSHHRSCIPCDLLPYQGPAEQVALLTEFILPASPP